MVVESGSPGFFAAITGFIVSVLILISWVAIIALIAILAKKLVSQILFSRNLKAADKKNNFVFLFIKIPSRNDQKETAMEDFLRGLHRTLPNNTRLTLEIAAQQQFLKFYIAIQKHYKSVLESQLYAQYPDAEIEEVKDYLPELKSDAKIAEMKFKKPSIYPINTYRTQEEDILKNLSALLAKTESEEQVFLQIALKRIGGKFWERGVAETIFQLTGRKYQQDNNPTPAYLKSSQDLYLGKLRVAYLAKDAATADTKLNSLIGIFKSTKARTNELKKSKFRVINNLTQAFQARIFETGDFYSPAELATLYHFPYKGNVTSNIVTSTSKRAPAPDILPKEGLVDPKEVSFIGTTNYRNENKVFGIKRIDRRKHLYVVGKTGGGKSKLLELLLIADIQSDQGCCLLDPHGDLAEEVLKYIPEKRIKDVVYINPSDRDYPVGFNPLEPVEDYETRQHLCTFFISIFKKLFAATWNQRMEHLIRYITLALLETPDSNILGIARMLSDTPFRQRVIMQIKDPVVKGFWTNEFSASAEQYSKEAVVPIMNKVGQFVANPVVRNMIGQRKNALDFGTFMNSGKIVILNISKGKIGDENASLLGSMFITKIQQAALERAKVPEEERRDFYFYIDEFQNFATEAFSTILSEARKYRLDLTIAHQYIAQLPEDVKATAFGNVGSLVVFSVGGDDAKYLEKEFAPTFSAEDLITLNAREMYIKMSIDGKVNPPFSAKTLTVPKSEFNFTDKILSHSRLTYGKNRVAVENEIQQWSQSNEVFPHVAPDEKFPEPIV